MRAVIISKRKKLKNCCTTSEQHWEIGNGCCSADVLIVVGWFHVQHFNCNQQRQQIIRKRRKTTTRQVGRRLKDAATRLLARMK